MKKTENRPRLKWGILSGVIGIVNLFTWPSRFWGGTFESIIDGLPQMIGCGLFLFFGYWLARKRVVVDDNSLRLVGLVDGKSDFTIATDQVTNVAFNHLKQKVEIQTASGKIFANLPEKSEALGILTRAIQEKKSLAGPV
jgi:hypothetical protein